MPCNLLRPRQITALADSLLRLILLFRPTFSQHISAGAVAIPRTQSPSILRLTFILPGKPHPATFQRRTRFNPTWATTLVAMHSSQNLRQMDRWFTPLFLVANRSIRVAVSR